MLFMILVKGLALNLNISSTASTVASDKRGKWNRHDCGVSYTDTFLTLNNHKMA